MKIDLRCYSVVKYGSRFIALSPLQGVTRAVAGIDNCEAPCQTRWGDYSGKVGRGQEETG